jgi:lipopolysaccharide export LptBFGC system permease protein LptF
MIGSRRWQILALIAMALVGVFFGIWLFRAGFTTLGCVYIGVFLWRGQHLQFGSLLHNRLRQMSHFL